MRCKQWNLKSDINDNRPIIDRLLDIRGIKNEDARREFLHPLEITLMHPNAFCEMQKAVDRIVKAIDEKEKILIYGDFDADGVTSTSVLYNISTLFLDFISLIKVSSARNLLYPQ